MYRLYRRHFVVQLLNLLALLFLLGHHVLQILQLKFKNHDQRAHVHILQILQFKFKKSMIRGSMDELLAATSYKGLSLEVYQHLNQLPI